MRQSILQLVIWAVLFRLGSMMNGLDIDPNDELDDDHFRAKFGLRRIKNPRLKAKRERALRQHEAIIKKENIEYAKGRKSWFDKVNDFSDLTDEERTKQKTGAQKPDRYGRGLLPHFDVDERSERYFDQYRYSRGSAPASYNAVEKGFVSPVKNQKRCGSCAAFATIACVETCYKKVTGVFGDYSEQELVDCGMYGASGANGCNGATIYAYSKWIKDKKRKLTSEEDYPYLGSNPRYSCPPEKPLAQGAQVNDYFYTNNGNEEMLKKLVAEHGAVLIAVHADSTFSYYGGGILSRCSKNGRWDLNHAVTVVGYGTDGGKDYWLIKNSWGDWWGENGYIKLARGSNACSVGWWITVVKCTQA